MPFKERLKAKFGKNKKAESGGSTPSTASTEEYYTGRTDIEYYKPHEIPKSKYRCKVDKEHQETLDSFSFVDAFQSMKRRTSLALSGTFSPGGTKAQSAAPSAAASRRTSWVSRNQSVVSSASGSSPHDGMVRGLSAANVPRQMPQYIRENSDDDTNVANAGLFRIATQKDVLSKETPTIRLEREATVIQPSGELDTIKTHDTPFTAEELERAMTKVALAPNDSTALHQTSVAVH